MIVIVHDGQVVCAIEDADELLEMIKNGEIDFTF